MTKQSQQLPAGAGRDKIEVAPWVLNIIWAVCAPFEFLVGFAIVGFARSFSGAMQNKGQKDTFEDPVYKRNLQRLIERNRQFEEEKNESRS